MKAFYWPLMYPNLVERFASFVISPGTERLSIDLSLSVVPQELAHIINGEERNHKWLFSIIYGGICSFIEGPKSALLASRDFHAGEYVVNPDAGRRAFGRAYCESYG